MKGGWWCGGCLVWWVVGVVGEGVVVVEVCIVCFFEGGLC